MEMLDPEYGGRATLSTKLVLSDMKLVTNRPNVDMNMKHGRKARA